MKKLSLRSNQGRKEFINEAKLLARVQHRNVVNLLGYCARGSEKLLVYEYVPHESLDKFLFSKSFHTIPACVHTHYMPSKVSRLCRLLNIKFNDSEFKILIFKKLKFEIWVVRFEIQQFKLGQLLCLTLKLRSRYQSILYILK